MKTSIMRRGVAGTVDAVLGMLLAMAVMTSAWL